MRKLLVALALLLVWIGTPLAKTVFIGTNGIASVQPTPPSNCPFTTDNGCAAAAIAQAGSTAATTFLGTSARNPGGMLNQLVATTTNYATSGPNQNQPGLEYAAGEVLPVSSLADPALGGLPTGCSYSATGNVSGGPQVTCSFNSGFNGQDLSGWSFDSNGSHHCVALYITGTAAGTATGSNDLIRNGTADCAVFTASGGKATQLATDDGLGVFTLKNVSFDGNSLASPSTTWQTYQGGCAASSSLTCNGGTEVWLVAGTFTCDYCSIINYWARPITYDGDAPMSVTHSYISGCCMADPTAHSEYLQYASTTTTPGLGTGFTFKGNTIIVTTAHQNIGLAMLPANFGTDTFVDSMDEENNLILIGYGGGGGDSYSVNGATSTVIGDVFTAGTVTGTANGATGGLLGNGSLEVCSTTGSALSFTLAYAGLSGTTSAGPGGGGFGGTGSQWLMDLNQATITSFIDDGTAYPSPSGVAGNVLSVTADTSMNMLTTNGVSVSGHAVTGSSSVTGHPGSGGVGQYVVGGSAAVVGAANVAAVPVNHLHGGWDIPPGVTLTCSNLTSGSAPWTSAISDDFSPGFNQITRKNNYVDLQVYDSDQNYWSQRTGVTQLGGHISGTTLTLDGIGGTVMVNKGTGYSSATVTYTGGTGCSTEPTGSTVLFLGTVNSITQVTPGGGCTTVPTATVSAPQGGTFTGSITSNVLTVSTTPTLSVKIIPSTTTLTSVSGNPTVGTQITGGSGGPGTYNVTSANLGSTTITASGVQATATAEFVFGSAFSKSELLTGTGITEPAYVTAGSGLSWTITPSQTVAQGFIVPLNTWCFNPTSWGGNVEMSNPSLNTPTIMNNYTSVVSGNGCVTAFPPPGPGTCAASLAFFTRAAANIAAAPTTYTPSISTWESAVDGLICGQVTAGTWANKDIEYFFPAPSLALAEMNLVSSSFTLTPSGVVAFDPTVGVYTDHATTSFFDTGYDPLVTNNPLSQMTSSSGYLGICQLNNNPGNNVGGPGIGELGTGGTNGMQVAPTGAGGPFLVTQMQGTTTSVVNSLGDQGGFVVSRTDNAHIQAYYNGLPVGTTPKPSTGGIVGGTTLYVLGAHVSGGTTQISQGTLALAAAGAGETAAQVLADHTIFSTALSTMLIQPIVAGGSGC